MANTNATSVLWNSELTDEEMESLVMGNNLHIVNLPGFPPIFEGRGGAISNTDITTVTQNMVPSIQNCNVIQL